MQIRTGLQGTVANTGNWATLHTPCMVHYVTDACSKLQPEQPLTVKKTSVTCREVVNFGHVSLANVECFEWERDDQPAAAIIPAGLSEVLDRFHQFLSRFR